MARPPEGFTDEEALEWLRRSRANQDLTLEVTDRHAVARMAAIVARATQKARNHGVSPY